MNKSQTSLYSLSRPIARPSKTACKDKAKTVKKSRIALLVKGLLSSASQNSSVPEMTNSFLSVEQIVFISYCEINEAYLKLCAA